MNVASGLKRFCVVVGLLTAITPPPVQAQTFPVFQEPIVASIDFNRLFSQSNFGKAALSDVEQKSAALTAENEKITADLTQEEQQLTEDRKTDDPEVFKQKAQSFDEKVQRIRAEQEEKLREIGQILETARRDFNSQAEPILRELMIERGIQFILDDSAIRISLPDGDITDEAIERINQVMQ